MAAFAPLPPPPDSPAILHEIFSQPEVLARGLGETRAEIERIVTARSEAPRRVLFVGCGDMHIAARVASWRARDVGLEAEACRSMDLRWIGPRLDARDLLVCASVSGRTPRTIEAARVARQRGAQVLGITDDPDALLASSCDAVAALRTSPPESLARGEYPGYQFQVPQTKTFTAALLAELCLVRALTPAPRRGEGTLESLPARLESWLPRLREEAAAIASAALTSKESVLVLASGPHLPCAHHAAAKLLEYAIPARAQCLEEMNHLDIFVADSRTLLVALAPDESSSQRLAELVTPWTDLGVDVLSVGPRTRVDRELVWPLPSVPSELLPFLLAVVGQLLAYEAARSLGRDPERWLGGVRTELLNRTSRATIRASSIETRWPGDDSRGPREKPA